MVPLAARFPKKTKGKTAEHEQGNEWERDEERFRGDPGHKNWSQSLKNPVSHTYITNRYDRPAR